VREGRGSIYDSVVIKIHSDALPLVLLILFCAYDQAAPRAPTSVQDFFNLDYLLALFTHRALVDVVNAGTSAAVLCQPGCCV